MDQHVSSLDLKKKDPGSKRPREPAGSYWQERWVSNIAIKITAPLLWGLVFVGVALSFYLSSDIDKKLSKTLNDHADHSTYVVSRALMLNKTDFDSIAKGIVDNHHMMDHATRVQFDAIRIQLETRTWSFGQKTKDAETIKRSLIVPAVTPGYKAEIQFFHKPMRSLIKKERMRLLISAVVPTILLGIALAFLIQRLIIRPIRDLVATTQKISSGDMSLRINSKREDEFGHLERFFDEMLDQLQDQKEQLQTALNSAQTADRAKSKFLANMSHELRTPLNAIIGYSELIMETLDEKKEKEIEHLGDLERIRSAGQHLLSLINDILDIAKIEAGKMEISKSYFRIVDMIGDVAATAMPMMIHNNNHAEISCPENIGEIESDELRIRQVLINLMSNAAKFTQDGNVKLLVERYSMNGSDWVRFSVIDDGIGISNFHSKRLFNEFAQIEDHIKGKPRGTGLGLAISRKFCNLMGGDIRLESTPGVGSTFIVDLPANLPSQIEAVARGL